MFRKISMYLSVVVVILLFFITACTGEEPGGILPPTIPAALNPANESVSVQTPVTLQWNSANALLFDLYFGTDQNPQLVQQNIAINNFSPANLIAGQIYYWKIVAKGLGGETSSPMYKFTTQYEPPSQGESGVELEDVSAQKSSVVQQKIKGYSMTQIRGIEIILDFDENYISLPQNLQDSVELLGNLAGALKIITQPQPGRINISVSLANPVNIDSSEILKVNFNGNGVAGVSEISVVNGSKIVDANFNEIAFQINDKGIIFLHD